MSTIILLLSFILYPLLILSGDTDVDLEDLICPFTEQATMPNGATDPNTPDIFTYKKALLKLNIPDVFQDIYNLLSSSQDCWPADTLGGVQSYGGLFIRLAWHCSGSFRNTDGQGGCAGGRLRFDPEASWDDNVQLDKARALLYPIKKKYGNALRYILYIMYYICDMFQNM